MKKSTIIILAILGACAFTVLVLVSESIGRYNSMVSQNQGVGQAWSQVENVYQRRFDLIPNLVETVKGAANFEKETLTGIAQARASVGQIKMEMPPGGAPDAAQIQKFAAAQQSLGSALSRLMVVSERYPELKANANFRDLQAQIEGTENRITVERQKFNEVTGSYNVTIQRFPNSILAGMFHFSEKPYFKVESEDAKHAPKVNFSASK